MTVTIGGSSAAAACGVDPFKSRVQLWLELTGRVERAEAGEAAEWGHRLEPVIAEAVEARGYVVGLGADGPMWSADHAWMTGTPDGYVATATAAGDVEPRDGNGLLEVKTAGLRMARLWDDGETPIPYVIQVQHYLALTGLEWALVACLIGGQRLVLRELERDETLIEKIIELEAEFVRMVERDEAPAPDGSASADAMLALLYPHATGDVATFTAAQMEEVERCKSLKRAAKATAGQLAESEQTIKAWIGEAPAAYHEGRKVVTWGSVTPKARKVQGKRLAEELPDVFAEYSYLPESYRRFEVK